MVVPGRFFGSLYVKNYTTRTVNFGDLISNSVISIEKVAKRSHR